MAGTMRVSVLPLQTLMAASSFLFLGTMALMLFHPPDIHFSLDRFAFALLIFVVLLRACVLREPLELAGAVTLPMLALLLLAFHDSLEHPYETETWSLFAAKWLVPFVLYQLAGLVFRDAGSLRRLEVFSLVVLAYLSLIAIFFMAGARELIFPPYILDEGLGYHADRARGPFLQAVANGVTLNLLGLIALDSLRRRRLRAGLALFFFIALPLAIVATRTRAVWLSFAGSVVYLLFFSTSLRVRRVCFALVVAGALGLGIFASLSDQRTSLAERLEESGPVKFRMEVYEAGWTMFLQKPLTGWGAVAMTDELDRRVSDFHQEHFYFHNTFLEILVEYGLIGLALYLWLVVDLFRLGKKQLRPELSSNTFMDSHFRSLWPLLLAVYFANAMMVVMNYQFVNGFVFTLAGVLAAQNRWRGESPIHVLAS